MSPLNEFIYLMVLLICLCYIAPNGTMIVNDKLKGIWKEEVVIYFKVQLRNFPVATEE
jgi:hypothetical protein